MVATHVEVKNRGDRVAEPFGFRLTSASEDTSNTFCSEPVPSQPCLCELAYAPSL